MIRVGCLILFISVESLVAAPAIAPTLTLQDKILTALIPTLAYESEDDDESPMFVRVPPNPNTYGDQTKPIEHHIGALNSDEYTILNLASALHAAVMNAAGTPVESVYDPAGPCNRSRCVAVGAEKTAAAVRKVFGVELFEGRRLASQNWSDAGPLYLYYFNSKSLIQIFKRLYQKPGTTVLGLDTRTIYRFAMKFYVRGLMKEWKPFLEKKKEFIDCPSAAYRKQEIREGFYLGFVDECKSITLPENSALLSGRMSLKTYWFLIRREADGSLPAMRYALRTVLSDYDPKSFAKLRNVL